MNIHLTTIPMPDFEWNRFKAVANFGAHNVSFEEAALVWDSAVALDVSSPRAHAAEDRRIRFDATSDGRILAVVYVMRDSTVRLISARRASREERQRYAQEQQHQQQRQRQAEADDIE